MASNGGYIFCLALYVLAHLFGVAALVLLGLLVDFDKSGFGFREAPAKEFKFHPLCMMMSLLFLNGEAMMIYRGLRYMPKYVTKAMHAILHLVSFTIMVLGLKAAWDSKDFSRDEAGNLAPRPNALSPHSWAGLMAASLYGLQFAGGLVSFYFPPTPLSLREAVMPMHRVGGIVIFCVSLGALLIGFGYFAGTGSCESDQPNLCAHRLYANFYVLSLLGYAACVLGIVTRPEWIRQPLPSEVNTIVPIGTAPAYGSVVMATSHPSPPIHAGAWSTTQEAHVHRRHIDPHGNQVHIERHERVKTQL